MIVYCTGYLGERTVKPGSKVAAFKAMVERMEATLFDIRKNPWSRAPCWRKAALEQLLGDRYRHIPALGNKNYNTGKEIEIVDLPTGLRQILASPKTVILMCGCEDFEDCHRLTVATALGLIPGIDDVIELHLWDKAGTQ